MSNFYLTISEEISKQFRDYNIWPEKDICSSTHWTSKIKAAMIAANRNDNIELRFTDKVNEQKTNWEFLYDFIFLYTGKNSIGDGYFKDKNIIQKVVAAVESEFNANANEILYDFAKLLIAKADLRVMVFYNRSNSESQTVIDEMVRRVATFQQSDKKDLYLLCWFDHDLLNFRYCLIDGTGETVKAWK